MTGIDWLAVDFVCSGTPLKLRPAEKKAVMRRLAHRMLTSADRWDEPHKLTAAEVARRLRTTDRSIARYIAELPPATKTYCPVCRGEMWVADGVVEPHPDSLFNECPMTGETVRRGLASIRPDLYQWLETA